MGQELLQQLGLQDIPVTWKNDYSQLLKFAQTSFKDSRWLEAYLKWLEQEKSVDKTTTVS